MTCLIEVGESGARCSETVSLCTASCLTNKHTTPRKQVVLTSLRRFTRCSTLLFHACPSTISDEDCGVLLLPVRALAEVALLPPIATVGHVTSLLSGDGVDVTRPELERSREHVSLSNFFCCTLSGSGFGAAPELSVLPLRDDRMSLC
jgi:hypothetical protein